MLALRIQLPAGASAPHKLRCQVGAGGKKSKYAEKCIGGRCKCRIGKRCYGWIEIHADPACCD